jgi:hypothetical protein
MTVLRLGEHLTPDIREVKDADYALCPVVGYIAFSRERFVAIPALQRTEAKVVDTEGQAMEYIELVHRRGSHEVR